MKNIFKNLFGTGKRRGNKLTYKKADFAWRTPPDDTPQSKVEFLSELTKLERQNTDFGRLCHVEKAPFASEMNTKNGTVADHTRMNDWRTLKYAFLNALDTEISHLKEEKYLAFQARELAEDKHLELVTPPGDGEDIAHERELNTTAFQKHHAQEKTDAHLINISATEAENRETHAKGKLKETQISTDAVKHAHDVQKIQQHPAAATAISVEKAERLNAQNPDNIVAHEQLAQKEAETIDKYESKSGQPASNNTPSQKRYEKTNEATWNNDSVDKTEKTAPDTESIYTPHEERPKYRKGIIEYNYLFNCTKKEFWVFLCCAILLIGVDMVTYKKMFTTVFNIHDDLQSFIAALIVVGLSKFLIMPILLFFKRLWRKMTSIALRTILIILGLCVLGNAFMVGYLTLSEENHMSLLRRKSSVQNQISATEMQLSKTSDPGYSKQLQSDINASRQHLKHIKSRLYWYMSDAYESLKIISIAMISLLSIATGGFLFAFSSLIYMTLQAEKEKVSAKDWYAQTTANYNQKVKLRKDTLPQLFEELKTSEKNIQLKEQQVYTNP